MNLSTRSTGFWELKQESCRKGSVPRGANIPVPQVGPHRPLSEKPTKRDTYLQNSAEQGPTGHRILWLFYNAVPSHHPGHHGTWERFFIYVFRLLAPQSWIPEPERHVSPGRLFQCTLRSSPIAQSEPVLSQFSEWSPCPPTSKKATLICICLIACSGPISGYFLHLLHGTQRFLRWNSWVLSGNVWSLSFVLRIPREEFAV